MNVLVDTSVWVGHFKQSNEHLVALLEQGRVVCHPYVVVELACGTPPRRRPILEHLAMLDMVTVAKPEEVLVLIEQRGLMGRECGFVDLSLLARRCCRVGPNSGRGIKGFRPSPQRWAWLTGRSFSPDLALAAI